jgi:hypothetical protein
MAKYRLLPIDKSEISLLRLNGKEETELAKLTIPQYSTYNILHCSDGTMLKVTTENDVVDFGILVNGSAKATIANSDILKKQNGSCELEGDFKWFSIAVNPQKVFITE